MKKIVAFLLAVVMCFGLCSCCLSGLRGPSISVEASQCQELIERIGEVTLDSGDAIEAAEDAYNALSEEDQAQIAVAAADLKAARASYDEMVAQQESKERVDRVVSLINAIGKVSLESRQAVQDAEDAYNNLTLDEQDSVTNYAVLEAAKEAYDELLKAEQDRIKAEKEKIRKEYAGKFRVKTDKVEGITWYNPKKMPNYIDIRSYLIPYIGVRNGTPWICIRYNYTGDEWIFWESLKIVVDGETYTKVVGYSNVVRDNDTEVWEYYDEVMDYSQALDSDELVMLKKIAESDETIVRFQGDNYHYDLYVSAADKAMIKETLKYYEALLP